MKAVKSITVTAVPLGWRGVEHCAALAYPNPFDRARGAEGYPRLRPNFSSHRFGLRDGVFSGTTTDHKSEILLARVAGQGRSGHGFPFNYLKLL
jgi:hypothetical protein